MEKGAVRHSFAKRGVWSLFRISSGAHPKKINRIPDGYPVYLARWKGFEPPTFWFVAKHSIQLSYQRISFTEHCLL